LAAAHFFGAGADFEDVAVWLRPAALGAFRDLLAREPGAPGGGSARAVVDGAVQGDEVPDQLVPAIVVNADLERGRSPSAPHIIRGLRRTSSPPIRRRTAILVVPDETHVAVGKLEGGHSVVRAGRRFAIRHGR